MKNFKDKAFNYHSIHMKLKSREINFDKNVNEVEPKRFSDYFLTQNISIKYNVISVTDDTQRCKREKLELIYRLSMK